MIMSAIVPIEKLRQMRKLSSVWTCLIGSHS